MTTDRERAAAALFHLDPDCHREEWVKAGMAAKAAALSFDDFHNWSKSGANYAGKRDCQTVWKSFKKSGPVTASSLYAMAYAQGWQDPTKCRQAANGSLASCTPPVPRKKPTSGVKHAKSAEATEVWELCMPAPSTHGYIGRKQGSAEGLRVYPHEAPPLVIQGQNVSGFLVVPCRDLDGNLHTLQFIPEKGGKLNLAGASFGNGCFVVGDIAKSSRLFIVEGIGQAWAAWKATGCAAVVCFGAPRMATVAAVLRDKYSAARLVVLPDQGMEAQAEAIALTINGEWCELPADKPRNYDANDFMVEHGDQALAHLLELTKTPRKPEPRFKLLGSADLHALQPLRWRVQGVFPAEGLAGLYGPSASGKSFLGLDVAAAIAEGRRWFDCRVEATSVVYAVLEGEAGFRQRVAAWEAHNRRNLPDELRMLLQPFKLTERCDVQDLAAVVPAGAVIFIDTLNRAAPTADENSSRDMGEILEAAKYLQALTGGLVVLVHHTGKDSTRGLRGHSSLFAALDAAIEVCRDGERREWRVAKSKDGTDGAAHPFKLRVETLGVDEYGDLITSCVVVPDTVVEDVKRVKLPQGGNQKLVLDALRPLFKKDGKTGKPGAPPLKPCIELEAAIASASKHMTCEQFRRATRTREAISGLISRGVIGCNEGWIWLVQ